MIEPSPAPKPVASSVKIEAALGMSAVTDVRSEVDAVGKVNVEAASMQLLMKSKPEKKPLGAYAIVLISAASMYCVS